MQGGGGKKPQASSRKPLLTANCQLLTADPTPQELKIVQEYANQRIIQLH